MNLIFHFASMGIFYFILRLLSLFCSKKHIEKYFLKLRCTLATQVLALKVLDLLLWFNCCHVYRYVLKLDCLATSKTCSGVYLVTYNDDATATTEDEENADDDDNADADKPDNADDDDDDDPAYQKTSFINIFCSLKCSSGFHMSVALWRKEMDILGLMWRRSLWYFLLTKRVLYPTDHFKL